MGQTFSSARVVPPAMKTALDMFGPHEVNTLGNIVANPGAGLLFVDFERRATLQLSGRAEVIWDPEGTAKLPGISGPWPRWPIENVTELVPASRPWKARVSPTISNLPV